MDSLIPYAMRFSLLIHSLDNLYIAKCSGQRILQWWIGLNSEPQISIREMFPGEKNEVERLFSRSLGILDRIVFLLSFEEAERSAKKQTGGTLVAVHEDRVMGSVCVMTRLVKEEKTGFIDALVVDREREELE